MTTETLTATGHQVTVYGRPGCQPCKAMSKALDRAGVPHTYLDVTVDPEARAAALFHGWETTPVVEVRDQEGTVQAAWHGLRVEHAKALAVPSTDVATLDHRV